jgi:hypothetical protein
MCGREYVLVCDDCAAAEWRTEAAVGQAHQPRELVRGGLSAADDPGGIKIWKDKYCPPTFYFLFTWLWPITPTHLAINLIYTLSSSRVQQIILFKQKVFVF